jgi:5-methylcytosine-specific restriction endonuclease McrA
VDVLRPTVLGKEECYRRALEYNRKWKARNKEKVRAHNTKRKAILRQIEGSFTDNDIVRLVAEQGNQCPGCFKSFDNISHTIDHFIPLSRGGTNWSDNLQLLCRSCNCSKKNKLWKDWKTA